MFRIEWLLETSKVMLNWKSKISLEEGVKILLEDMNYWQDAPIWEKNSIAKATGNGLKI